MVQARRITKNFKIIVLDRGEDNTEDIIEKSEFLKNINHLL